MAAELNTDIYTADAFADPYTFYGRIRENDPVHFSEQYETWLITRYEDVSWLLKRPELFSSELVRRDSRAPAPPIDPADADELRFITEFRAKEFIQSDPPAHSRMRAVLNKYFSPKGMERWREAVRGAVNGLLDAATAHETNVDIAEQLARPLPLLVISEMLGIPAADRPLVKRQADERMLSALSLQPDRMRRSAAGIRESSAYLNRQIDSRLAQPQDDLLGTLAEAERSGQYDREEVLANAQSLIDAGHETTIQLICNGVLAFLRNPDQWKKFCADPEALVETATEECLRFDPPLPAPRRIAAKDIELRGKTIRVGDRVTWVIAAANRDPQAFERPDEFDIMRSPNRHLSFGSGIHYCLGQYLARIEGQETFIALARRFPTIRLKNDALEYAPIRGVRMLKSLPVVL